MKEKENSLFFFTFFLEEGVAGMIYFVFFALIIIFIYKYIGPSIKGQAGNSEITISYSPSRFYTDYEVYYKRAGETNASLTRLTMTTSTGVSSYGILTQLTNGQPYDFYLKAQCVWNSCVKQVAHIQMTPLLTPPDNFKAITGQKSATITLSWSPVPNATGYEIVRSSATNDPTNFTTIATISSAQMTTYIDASDLVNEKTYKYRIAAIDSRSTSAFSSTISATPQLTPPDNFNAVSGQKSATVALSWSPVANATGYKIVRSSANNDPTSFTTIATISSSQTTTHIDASGLVNGETYNYWIQAMDSLSTSASWSIVSATPQLTPPTNFKAKTGQESATIVLTWSTVDKATGYEIQRASRIYGRNNFNTIAIVCNAQINTYIDVSDLVNGKTYYYKIAAKDSRLTSAFSSTVSATPELALPTNFKTISIRKGDLTKENVGRENWF